MKFEMPDTYTEIAGDQGPAYVFPFDPEADPDVAEFVRPPATDEQLDRFEQGIGGTLPESLREMYKRYHPFEFFPRGFKYRYTAQDLVVLQAAIDPDDAFITHPVGRARYSLLLDEDDGEGTILGTRAALAEYLPSGFLPLVEVSPGGNLLLMDLNPGDSHGSMWFFMLHGIAAIVERGLEVPLGYVAADFDTFLRGLYDRDAEIEREIDALG